MKNQDGGLYFESSLDNEQLLRAIDEAVKSIQGISSSAEESGSKMNAAFNKSAEEIRSALGMMGKACEIHESEIAQLEAKYKELGVSLQSASDKGDSKGVEKIREEIQAVEGQIVIRKKMLQEVRETSNELETLAQKKEKERQETEKNTQAQQSLRGRIRELREEMALLIDQGIDEQSEAYKALVNELGRLQDIQGDIAQQGKILANDEAKFQGVLQGLSGLAGGFSAATGAMALFGEENEELQRVMAKVQAVMAVTMGMQQIAQTLNKDSAFRLVTLNGLKKTWTKLTRIATGADLAEAAAKKAVATSSVEAAGAETADAAAKGVGTVAAGTATVANFTLAGAIRAVGVAISSIPVFGWILAGIGTLIALVSHFTSKAKEAKKSQEEFTKSMAEGCYKTVGKVEQLSHAWEKLGDNMKAKEKFVKDNKKAFDELGVSIKNVRDAENLLIKNKDAFIDAQIAKARASVWLEKSMDEVRDIMTLEDQYSRMPDKVKKEALSGSVTSGMHSYTSYEVDNEEKKDLAKIIDAKKRRQRQMLENSYIASKNEEYYMKKGGITPLDEFDKPSKSIKDVKDPYIEQLDKRKQAYLETQKLLASSDQKTREEGETRWANLKAQGDSYLEYLKQEREKLEGLGKLSAKQQAHLMELYKRIAEEDQDGILDLFGRDLKQSLTSADGVVDKISMIKDAYKKELGGDGIDKEKKKLIENEERQLLAQSLASLSKAQGEHRNFLNHKKTDYERYTADIVRLEEALAGELSDIQRKILTTELETARVKREDARANEYEALIEEFRTFEEKRVELEKEYAEKRALAGDNEDLKARIEEERQKKQSALAVEELQKSEAWSNLFSDLDSLASEKIEILIAEIESKFSTLSGVFNPIDLDAIRKKLNEARSVLIERNPFAELGNALKAALETSEGENRKSTEQIKLDWKNLAQATYKSFDFVHDAVESCAPLKEVIGEVGETALGSLEAVAAASIAVATAIKTAEASTVVLAVIQAALVAVQAIFSILKLHDKKREKSIQEHTKNIKRLEREYHNLERAIDRAFGEEKYNNARKAIKNLEKTAEEARKKEEEERKKKKPDEDKAEEYAQEVERIEQQREDFINKLRDEILGGSAKSIAEELGNAFVDAFARGEDALEAWGKSVDKMIQGIAKRMIVEMLLGRQIEAVMQQYTEQWMGGDGKIDTDKVVGGANSFAEALNKVGAKNKDAIEAILKAMGISKDMGNETTLKGAIKGVTEKTAGLIEGQMNAIRINQLKTTELMREQLQRLSAIEYNTKYLISIDKKLTGVRSNNDRAFGL